jgi:hypothetical protein
MSQATNRDPEDLSDDELLARIAEYDEEEYPLAKYAKRALDDDGQDSEEESS